jgi:hypothetical protein
VLLAAGWSVLTALFLADLNGAPGHGLERVA